MSFPTVYYITQVIPPCYTAGYAMCVCVSFGACVYRSLGIVVMDVMCCVCVFGMFAVMLGRIFFLQLLREGIWACMRCRCACLC